MRLVWDHLFCEGGAPHPGGVLQRPQGPPPGLHVRSRGLGGCRASSGSRRVSARNHFPDAEPGEVLPLGARLVSFVDE
eukprot:3886248-Alexandrium_andersonii.AAC.1